MIPLIETPYNKYIYFWSIVESGPLEYNVLLQEYVSSPEEDPIPVDETFMINLLRRPDRRKRMEASFAELRLDVTIVNAVDGQ